MSSNLDLEIEQLQAKIAKLTAELSELGDHALDSTQIELESWESITNKLKKSKKEFEESDLIRILTRAVSENQYHVLSLIFEDAFLRDKLSEKNLETLFKNIIEKKNIPCLVRMINNGYRPNEESLKYAIDFAVKNSYDITLLNALVYLNNHHHLNVDLNRPVPIPERFKPDQSTVCTLLELSVKYPNAMLTEELLKGGADPNKRGLLSRNENLGVTAGFICNYVDNFEVLELLLKAKLDLNAPIGEHPNTEPLYYYILSTIKQNETLDDLILNFVKPNDLMNPNVLRPFNILSEVFGLRKKRTDLFEKILKKGGADLIKKVGFSAIIDIIKKGDNDEEVASYISMILQYGILNLEQQDKNGNTVLELAFKLGHFKTVSLLHAHGAEVTPLIHKTWQERLEGDPRTVLINKLLLSPTLTDDDFDQGAEFVAQKLDRLNISQLTKDEALIKASTKNKKDIAIVLIGNGANPENLRSWDYITRTTGIEFNRDSYKYAYQLLIELTKAGDLKGIQLLINSGLPLLRPEALPALQQAIDISKASRNDKIQTLLEKHLKESENINTARRDLEKNKGKSDQEKMRLQLLTAIAQGDRQGVIQLVKEGSDPGNLGLCYPRESGFERIVLKGGGWLHADGVSPLHMACMYHSIPNSVEIFQVLLDLGADFHLANDYAKVRFGKYLKYLIPEHHPQKDILYRLCEKAELKIKRPQTPQEIYESSLKLIKQNALAPVSPTMGFREEDLTEMFGNMHKNLKNVIANQNSNEAVDFIRQFFLLLNNFDIKINAQSSKETNMRDSLNNLFCLSIDLNKPECCKAFLESGYIPDEQIAAYVFYAALKHSNDGFANYFLEYCSKYNIKLNLNDAKIYERTSDNGDVIRNKFDPLQIALLNNTPSLVLNLLKLGANPNEELLGKPLCLIALVQGHTTGNYRTFQALVEAGANLKSINPSDLETFLKNPKILPTLISLVDFSVTQSQPSIKEILEPYLARLKAETKDALDSPPPLRFSPGSIPSTVANQSIAADPDTPPDKSTVTPKKPGG